MKKAAIEELFSRFQAAEPEPKTELITPFDSPSLRASHDRSGKTDSPSLRAPHDRSGKTDSPSLRASHDRSGKYEYCLLVAIILSAQATDVGVNKATPALFAVADTPQKMLTLGEDGLKEYIKTIGLYHSKARNIIAMSALLVERHGGKVPETRDELVALPGVGRKTANVWLNCARGEPTIAVDTHVFRVANRLGLVKTKTPEQTETALEKVIPTRFKTHAHHWLILHGRYVCKARKPECERCTVVDLCEFKGKTI